MNENIVARIDATFENTLQLDAELDAVARIEKNKILCNTTEYWNSQPQLVSKEGYLYVYTDYKQVDNEDVPGIKVGDGTSYLIDMPFMDAPLDAHIADSVKHITSTERAFWNDKMDKTNPTGTGTFSLKDDNGNTKISLNSSTGDISCTSINGVTPTEVAANPSGTGSADLTKIKIGNSIYDIPQGGSSSGGHTILDDEGTSLTQRDDLQFKGAYSEDDSTNEKTVVNVARTMTSAEFEQLTDDEKAGFINVKDETSGSDDKFQPVIYSEEEREIGVYTDGKPLYQKTIISTSELSKNTINQIALGVTDIDVCVSVNGFASYGTNNTYVPLPYGDKNNSLICLMNINKSSGIANVWVGSDYETPNLINLVIITLRYTKTTDTPGSGQWTPQGVPAIHYSTDEQIIGTWIDGSPLYEKTLLTPSAVTIASTGAWISSGVSAPSGSTVIKADIVNLYVTGVVGIFVNDETQTIYLSNIPKVAPITIPANTPITARYIKS